MKTLLRVVGVVCLAAGPLAGSILVIDRDRTVAPSSDPPPVELSVLKSPSAYQNDLLSTLDRWLLANEIDTFGPLALGLILLLLPIRIALPKSRLQKGGPQQPGGDSNLQRIGQSWNPRF